MTHYDDGKSDLRVRRTRKFILNALIELTIEKGFEAVTVRDICERAMVNRSTFYHYYQDKYDLLHQYSEELYQVLDQPGTIRMIQEEAGSRSPGGLATLLEHVQSHAAFYRSMLGEKGDPGFARRIQKYIEKRLRMAVMSRLSQEKRNQVAIDLFLSYASAGAVGVLNWWLENELPLSPEQLAAGMSQLSLTDLKFMVESGLFSVPEHNQSQSRTKADEKH
jgi:AcrR family transcriptional regulator